MSIRTELFKHQKEAAAFVRGKPYAALLYQPGLGKTLAAFSIISERLDKNAEFRTLYITPNTLIENIIDEAIKHTSLTCIALSGSRKKRTELLKKPAHIYVINYEATRILTEELMAQKFDLVIFDESHCAKHHNSQQSKACYRIAMSCPERIIMTGTAIHNTPLDVYAQYRLLSTDIFGPSYYRFRARYAIMGGFLNKQVLKYINMDDFLRKIKRVSIIRTKEECLDLPPRLYEQVYVDLTPMQKKMYADLRDQFIAVMKDSVVTAPVMLTRIMRFSQITAGFYKDIEGKETSYEENPKQAWLVEWLKEHGYKTVVFVRFIKELKDLEEALRRNNIRFVTVYGATEGRIELVKQFNSSPEIQVFIGQIDTAGQGINLQSASYCVFLSNNYSYGDREQAESRIHRAGQLASNCTYIDVLARGTIDERVLKILKRKESLANMLTEDIMKVV